MGSNFTGLTVTHADESDGYATTTDVTSDVLSIPLFTDTGSGEVNEAEIVFTAKAGKHIHTGALFEEYDRFRIQLTDLSGNSYDRWFEVTDIIPSQSKSEGSVVTCRCLGIEYHTQVIHFAKREWFQNAFNVVNRIVETYNNNVGSRQPLITNQDSAYNTSTLIGNEMPKFTNNHYEFGSAEDSCYNRLSDMLDLLGGTVASGGVNDFFELGFETNAVNGIDIAMFSSGRRSIDGQDPTNDSSLVLIENTTSINVSEQEGGISNPTATRVCAWGSPDHGSLPTGFSKYSAEEFEFTFRPNWGTGILYKVDAKIIDGDSTSATVGRHYKCTEEHTSGTFATDLAAGKWTPIDMSDEFGDDKQYSAWTDDKTALWVNAGSNPSSTSSVPSWADSTSYDKYDIVSHGGAGFNAWLTSTSYVINDEITQSSKAYRCVEDHTSGTFGVDLAAGKWQEIQWRSTSSHTSTALVDEPGGAKWFDSTSYSTGDEVYHRRLIWTCKTNHTSTAATDEPGVGTSWQTKWNKGGTWEAVDFAVIGNGAGFWDSNVVIRDDGVFFRTWVDEKLASGDSAGTEWRFDDGTNPPPVGYRMLNIDFVTGTDRNGKDLQNSVLERMELRNAAGIDIGSEWVVKYKADETNDRMQVAVIDLGQVWEWNASTSTWSNKSTEVMNNECFHEYKNICNVTGFDSRPLETRDDKFPEVTLDGLPFAKNIRSAVEVTYSYNTFDNFPVSSSGYSKGAWLNFRFPFPINTYNGISEGVGDIYGGGTNESAVTRPSTLDIQNMSWTSDNRLGFNETTSEDLGPINAIGLHMRVTLEGVAGVKLDGIARIRATLMDIKDNMGYQDFEIKFTNNNETGTGTWQPIILPIGGFKPYRGREPKSVLLRGLSTIVNFEIPLKELDVNEQIEMQNIKQISFQIQDVYDDDGRYDPSIEMLGVDNHGVGTVGGGFMRMAIDAFHFKKTLLAISNTDSTRNIEPTFLQRPNIISYKQLLNDAKAQLEIEKFKHKEYNFQTSGRNIFDIPFGDTFFLKNADIVSDANKGESSLNANDGESNTVRLVAKRIEYHLTKPIAGSGGLTRTILGIKRFT